MNGKYKGSKTLLTFIGFDDVIVTSSVKTTVWFDDILGTSLTKIPGPPPKKKAKNSNSTLRHC